MVETQVSIVYIIVGHADRYKEATQLTQQLNGTLSLDTDGVGSRQAHINALLLGEAAGTTHVCIIEDDALPVSQFATVTEQYVNEYPEDLISFYLGTGRPPQWQPQITHRLASPIPTEGYPTITLPMLIHGVSYILPTKHVSKLVRRMQQSSYGADYALGAAWLDTTGRDVHYTRPSYVEHADGVSVEVHPDGQARTERRVAHELAVDVKK